MASGQRGVERLREQLRPQFPKIAPKVQSDLPASEEELLVDELRLVRDLTTPPLFDYQADLADTIVKSARPGSRLLLSLPTGAGKTRTAVMAVLMAMASGEYANCSWLAPSVELIDQAFTAFSTVWQRYGRAPDLLLRRGSGEPSSGDPDFSVSFLTPQAVYSNVKSGRRLRQSDLVVFDEAHQLGARTFRAAAEAMTASDVGPSRPLIGLSATPGRVSESETEDLVTLFRGCLLTSPLLAPDPVRALQRKGILAELRFRPFTRRSIGHAHESERIAVAARAAIELSRRGRRVMAFTATVPGAIVLSEALQSEGVPAAAVHASTEPEIRRATIDDFAQGKLHILTNQRLLATGYDCPAVTDVLILPKVSSPILFEQMVGRAARGPKTGGARQATIWQFDDHLAMHGRPQSYYRYRDYDWSSAR